MDRCTDKQAAILDKYGYDPNSSFEQASAIIDGLKANGWKRQDAPQQRRQGPPQRPQGPPPQYQNQAPQQPYPQQNGAPPRQQQRPSRQYASPPQNRGGYGGQGRGGQQQRDPNGPCTPNQSALLAKYGSPTNLSFSQASAEIDAIKQNGWQPLNDGYQGGGEQYDQASPQSGQAWGGPHDQPQYDDGQAAWGSQPQTQGNWQDDVPF